MKRKKIGIIVAVLVLVLAGSIGWNLRDLQQKRMLNGAESIAFTDVDGTERLLAQVDTTRLTESSQMLYNFLEWCKQVLDIKSSLFGECDMSIFYPSIQLCIFFSVHILHNQ